jgi:hypothetical protein
MSGANGSFRPILAISRTAYLTRRSCLSFNLRLLASQKPEENVAKLLNPGEDRWEDQAQHEANDHRAYPVNILVSGRYGVRAEDSRDTDQQEEWCHA